MTVSSTARRAGPFTGNGVTTSVPFTFRIFEAADIQVTHTDTTTGVESVLTLGTHYSVAVNADQSTSPGGTITYPISGDPLPATETLTIVGATDYEQDLDVSSAGRFLPEAFENALDKAVILIQQLKEKLGRALLFSVNDTDTEVTIPQAADRAGLYLAFDAAGAPTPSAGTGADAGLRTDLAASGGSALVKFLPAGTGAAARTLQARGRDVVNIADYSTLQAAINYASNTGRGVLEASAGVFTYTDQQTITMAGSNRGLVIRGASGNDILGNTGTVFDFSGVNGADAIAVTAGNAQAFLTLEGITFKGSGTVNHGLHFTNASYAQLVRCVLREFSKAGHAALRFSAVAGGFVGVVHLDRCGLQSNAKGVWVMGDNTNVWSMKRSALLGHSEAAVQFGEALTLQQNRVVDISGANTFEGNVRDLLCYSAMHGLAVNCNYIENNNNAHTAPRIELINDGTNADSSALSICNNQFQKSIVAAAQSIIALNAVAKGRIKDNFSAAGNDATKYFLYGENCTGLEFDVPHSPPGQTPAYPVVISRTGAAAAKTFTTAGTSDDRVPITTLVIVGSAEVLPGASTTTINAAQYSRHGDTVTVSLDVTLTVKDAGSTGYCNIAGLPFVNRGADARFDFASTSGVARTGPTYHGVIPAGALHIELTDVDLVQVDLPAFVSAGARLKATFSYLTT